MAAITSLGAFSKALITSGKPGASKSWPVLNSLMSAQALAEQTEDAGLQAQFQPLAKTLVENENKIVEEMAAIQGQPVDIGGYFFADPVKTKQIMRPSETFNNALASLK